MEGSPWSKSIKKVLAEDAMEVPREGGVELLECRGCFRVAPRSVRQVLCFLGATSDHFRSNPVAVAGVILR